MYYIFDILNGDDPCLNESTIYSFPSPWKRENVGTLNMTFSFTKTINEYTDTFTEKYDKSLNEKLRMPDELKNSVISNPDRFTGSYSHPLYGLFNVSEEGGILYVGYGRLLRGNLTHHSDSTFKLTMIGPLSEIFAPLSITISFEDLSEDNYFLRVRMNPNPISEWINGDVNKGGNHKISTVLSVLILIFSLLFFLNLNMQAIFLVWYDCNVSW